MKKYFAKYLPIEGEIKEHSVAITDKGDVVTVVHLFPDGENAEIESSQGDTETIALKFLRLTKLFLCSRDIQVGEIGYNTVTNSYHKLDEPESSYHGLGDIWIKVIGEISPEATWVKEGDEFDEDELKASSGIMYDPAIQEYRRAHVGSFVKLKGPCGHYH